MNRPLSDSRLQRLAQMVGAVSALGALAMTAACAADEGTAPGTDQASGPPAAERALEHTALEVAEAFANRDRGDVERTEEWLPQLRGEYEVADGVRVGHGEASDDGLVLLSHTAAKTYKCIAVTDAADVAGEPVQIARISVGQPRC